MSNDHRVAEHYAHGDLLNAIADALAKMGKTINEVTLDDLAPVDEFHIGGRPATRDFLGQLGLGEQQHVLDIGCGLGGAARYVADHYENRVTGIDLTAEYVDTGNALCAWLGLDTAVELHQGSALAMPFADQCFDGAWMMHVAMNVGDKAALFAEIARVLRPGAVLGVYDVMRIEAGELAYPVPWAAAAGNSHLATPGQYRQALADAGFSLSVERDRRAFALQFFAQLHARNEANGGPPALGLHTLMQETTGAKVSNMIANIKRGLIAPVELIARKI